MAAWLRDQPPLVRAFREGRRDALSAVYRHYINPVVRLLAAGFPSGGDPPSFVPGIADPGTQMDHAHEVFSRAFRESARMSYDGLRPYGPYLLRIAKNYRIDQLRSNGREVLTDAPPEMQSGGESERLEERHWKSLSEATREFMSGLDEERRRFVTLRFEDEQSQAEVAQSMGITRRRVRTLESRVLKELRKHLSKKGLT